MVCQSGPPWAFTPPLPHLHAVQNALKSGFLWEIGASSLHPLILHPHPHRDLSGCSERSSLYLDFGLGRVPSFNPWDASEWARVEA